MNTFWKICVALLVFAVTINWASLQIQENRIPLLEERISALEEENEDLKWSLRWQQQGQSQLFGYHMGAVLIKIDPSIGSDMGLALSIGGTLEEDVQEVLYQIERPFMIRLGFSWVDLSQELEGGDLLQAACNSSAVEGVSFWDNGSCLALFLQRVDGSHVSITP